MSEIKPEIGYIGLGKMGSNMVTRLNEYGVNVLAWDKNEKATKKIAKNGIFPAQNVDEIITILDRPRLIWLMVPVGEPTEETLDTLKSKLEPDDLIIDGGNSFYKDTLRRAKELRKKGIRFMDFGVAGGVEGARNGASLMIGGERDDFERVEWLAKIVAAPDAYTHVGPVGAGHFVSMVHSRIEYAMMQAVADGFEALVDGPFNLDLENIAKVYQRQTAIPARLIDWIHQALKVTQS